jgi:hypothetical protein
MNGTSVGMSVAGTFGFANLTTDAMHHVYKGMCPASELFAVICSIVIQDAFVIPNGPGGGCNSLGGRYFSWYHSIRLVRLCPTCKIGEAGNYTSWFSSHAHLMLLTQRQICIYLTAATLYQL